MAVVIVACPLWVDAQDPPPAVEPAPPTSDAAAPDEVVTPPELPAPPETVAELDTVRARLAQQIDSITPTTQPTASAPATQPTDPERDRATAAAAAWTALNTLLARVDQHLAIRREIAKLGDDEAIAAYNKELAAIQQQIKDVSDRIADPPLFVTEDDIKTASTTYDTAQQDLTARLAAQTERADRLASGAKRREAAANAVKQAQAAFQDAYRTLQPQIDATDDPVVRQTLTHRLTVARVAARNAMYDAAFQDALEDRDTLLQGREDRRITLLRQLVPKLAEWRNVLQQARSRSEKERFKAALEWANAHNSPAHVRLYWQLRLAIIAVRESLDTTEQSLIGVFPEAAAEVFKQQLAEQRRDWDLFMSTLERRGRERVRRRYRELESQIADLAADLAVKRAKFDQSVDEYRRDSSQIERKRDTIGRLEADFTKAVNAYLLDHPEDVETEKLVQEYAKAKRALQDRLQATKSDTDALFQRLTQTAQDIEKTRDQLAAYHRELFWYHLFAPANALWQYQWSVIRWEWTLPVNVAPPPGIEVDATTIAKYRREDRTQIRETIAGLTLWHWLGIGAAAAAALVAALRVRRRLRAYAKVLVERLSAEATQSEDQRAPVADRLHLQGAFFVARTAPVSWPAAAALPFVWFYDLRPPSSTLAAALLILIIGLSVTEGLTRVLFATARPRFRLLRCSNTVAGYYRRWLRLLWFVTLVLVPVPLALSLLGWMWMGLATRPLLWTVYKVLALSIVLIFGLRRQAVMRVAGRPEQITHRNLYTFARSIYPLVWLGVFFLLALEVFGYSALVTYTIRGTAASTATLLIALLLSRYLCDLILRWTETRASTAPSDGAGEAVAAEDDGSAVTGVAVTTVRLLFAVGSVVLVLQYWGITVVEVRAVLDYELIHGDPAMDRVPLSIGRILLAIGAVVAGWWASRGVRSVLNSKVYSIYAGIPRGAMAAFNRILHYFIVTLGVYFALVALHVPLGALTVALGTLGLGVGLGIQPLVVNFVSGLMILFERHVSVGDLVEIDGKLGEVTAIRMRSTTIKTFDNIEIVVPNSDFVTKNVINWTLQETRIRGRVDVGVAYGTDTELVRRLLLDIANRHPAVLRTPPPEVWFMSFGDSSLDFAVVAWFRNTSDRWRFMTEIRHEICHKFEEQGIEIPFPQRTLSTIGNEPLAIRIERAPRRGETPPAPPPPGDGSSPPGRAKGGST